MVRKVKNQSEFAFKTHTGIATGDTGNFKFSTPTDQVWGVMKIIVEAPPLCVVTCKYEEEETGNTVTLDDKYAYEFPLDFKKTATDTRMMLWEDRELTVVVSNPYGGTLKPRVGIEYIKNYRK